ncbi:DsbA family protein [Streptomyces sp. NPDC001262]|uniref:DsbA family protein n=1 Tax=unclassified Streptomyces TaxID=2593676 RepID=UPI003689D78C
MSARPPKNAQNTQNTKTAKSTKSTKPGKPAKPSRRIAAIGAIVALVVAVAAAGIAIGKSTGGSGKREPSATSGAANDPQQKAYDQYDKASARRQDGDPLALGKADAPVVLVEYADYQCSFCGRFTRETQPELIKKYVDTGVLRIEFRNFPIFGDPSVRAARASWAAGQQGKFHAFHDELFAKLRKGDALAEDKLVDMARTAGVADLDRFRTDMNGSAAEAAVKKDQEQGYAIGVQSTPSFLVNGRPLAGAQPMSAFEDVIAQAKAAKEAQAGDGKPGK